VCNLYSITTNQEAIRALFRVMNRYVGNLPAMPGVFPDYPAPVIRNAGVERELVLKRWGMPPPPRTGGPPVTNIRNTSSPHWRMWLKPENRCLVPGTGLHGPGNTGAAQRRISGARTLAAVMLFGFLPPRRTVP
jgi:putative SOS response-associated peptidase YedK